MRLTSEFVTANGVMMTLTHHSILLLIFTNFRVRVLLRGTVKYMLLQGNEYIKCAHYAGDCSE